MKSVSTLVAGAIAVMAALAETLPSNAQDLLYEGKTIDVVVPFSAGGSTDVFARLIASEMGERLPGKPTVKVVNMPGGGGVLGSNYVYNSGVTDGTKVLINSVMPWYQVISDPAVQYDVSKSPMIMTFGEPEVVYISKALGMSDPAKFSEAGKPLKAAALSPNNTKSVLFHLIAELLQYKTQVINGYPGGPEMRLAVQRGEADIGMETLSGFFGGIKQNENFELVMQSGVSEGGKYVPDPRLESFGLKTMFEIVEAGRGPAIWETVEGQALHTVADVYDVLRTVSLPPETDEKAVTVFRDTFNAMLADSDFIAKAEKINGYTLTYKTGEESQTIIQEMIKRLEQTDDLKKYIQAMTQG